MKPKVLFVNPPKPQCGVAQYGINLFSLLAPSAFYKFIFCEPEGWPGLGLYFDKFHPDAIIYNWSPGILGWIGHPQPFNFPVKNVGIYHGGSMDYGKFDAVLFSDPTLGREGNIFPIGRPVPEARPHQDFKTNCVPRIGVNGFGGAWAPLVARQVVLEFDQALLRLHLPYATHCDPHGVHSQHAAQSCLDICAMKPGIQVEVCFDFLSTQVMVDWLGMNDLNCYLRTDDGNWGRGVSSVLDVALAARRPIAINRFSGFRHLHHCSPSVCVEDNSLKTILANGTAALEPLYQSFAPEVIRSQVENALQTIGVC